MVEPEDVTRRRTLLKVLLLNVGLAITLAVSGIAADSTALLANRISWSASQSPQSRLTVGSRCFETRGGHGAASGRRS